MRVLVPCLLFVIAGCGDTSQPQVAKSQAGKPTAPALDEPTAPALDEPQQPVFGLVAYWPLDGTLDDAAPVGVTADHGTFVGKTSFQDGKIGKAIVLDGSNYVSIPTSEDLEVHNESISIVAWFRVDAWRGRYETLLGKGRGDKYSLAHHVIDPDRLAYFGGLHQDPMDAPAGGTVNDGRWHHVVAITVAGKKTQLFIDGKLVKSGGPDTAHLGDSGRPLLLGNNPEQSREDRRWIGAIDDVGIFSMALNAAEARGLHTLAASEAWGYDLGSTARLIRLHREQSPQLTSIGDSTWKYAHRDPGNGQPFVVLSERGSGVTTSRSPGVVAYSASRRFLDAGDAAELRWAVTDDATHVEITPPLGKLSGKSGSISISPTETTDYQITVRNEHGQTRAHLTVHVDYEFATPQISEFMADSAAEYPDADGDASDWIELHNPSSRMASTANLFLTDTVDDPTKWPIPEMIMDAGESIVIFASGKDRQNSDSELHTNFKLRAAGEYLALNHIPGTETAIVSSFGLRYPKQRRGISFGVDPSGTQGSLSVPTPNARNTEVVTGDLSSVQFSHTRSLCAAPFQLALTNDAPEASVYFTTDGSVPTPTSGQRYVQPIPIQATTVVRAAAFQNAMRRSPVSTHTYIFPASVANQSAAPAGFPEKWESFPADYAMDSTITEDPLYRGDLLTGLATIPSLSLTMPLPDLFGPNGVYSNPLDHGRAWERATSLEFIPPQHETGFQIDCGLRIYGGYGRNRKFPKHSLRVLFKGIYGQGKLRFPLFPDQGATQTFDTLILRGGFNNSWQAGSQRSQHLRDEFIRRSQLAMGQPSSHGMFVHLYLNGLYWGVYNVVERPSAAFAAAYLGGKRADYDALNSGKAIDGTEQSWRKMHEVAQASTPENVVDVLTEFVNLDNLIDYMLVNFYGGNDDWDGHNWYAARKREPGAQYHFFCWDAERTLGNAAGDNKTRVNRRNNPSSLFNHLLRHTAFRQRVLARVRLHLFDGGALTPERAAARYAKMSDQLNEAIVAESARWGDAQEQRRFNRNDAWIPERDRLLTSWFPQRSAVLLEQLNALGNLGYIKAPNLKISQESVEILATTGVVYFTTDGSDPRGADGSPHPDAQLVKGFTVENILLPKSSEWKYLDDGSDQGTAWREPEFDDSQWKSGKARLGYGDDGETTTTGYGPDGQNKYITTYFRRQLILDSTSTFDSVNLLLSRDDGGVVYLNGKELVRSNMPMQGTITFRTLAVRTHDNHEFLEYAVPRELINVGKNVIAAEIHQGTPASSDTGFDLALQGIKQNRLILPTASIKILNARTYEHDSWSSLTTYPAKPQK